MGSKLQMISTNLLQANIDITPSPKVEYIRIDKIVSLTSVYKSESYDKKIGWSFIIRIGDAALVHMTYDSEEEAINDMQKLIDIIK